MFSSENLVIKDKFIRRWVHKEGFSGFKRYVTAAEDKELEAKIAVVEKYNIRIPELVERIEKCHIEDLDFAGEEGTASSRPGGTRVGWSTSCMESRVATRVLCSRPLLGGREQRGCLLGALRLGCVCTQPRV